ncbi:MAG: hypothetical protein WC422_00490 [Candidatus Paceibacterota bacterium]|jgi:hypothetical protein
MSIKKVFCVVLIMVATFAFCGSAQSQLNLIISLSQNMKMDRVANFIVTRTEMSSEFITITFNDDIAPTAFFSSSPAHLSGTPRELWLNPGNNKLIARVGEVEAIIEFTVND